MDDVADGLGPLPLQEGVVVSLNNMDPHLAITYLKRERMMQPLSFQYVYFLPLVAARGITQILVSLH